MSLIRLFLTTGLVLQFGFAPSALAGNTAKDRTQATIYKKLRLINPREMSPEQLLKGLDEIDRLLDLLSHQLDSAEAKNSRNKADTIGEVMMSGGALSLFLTFLGVSKTGAGGARLMFRTWSIGAMAVSAYIVGENEYKARFDATQLEPGDITEARDELMQIRVKIQRSRAHLLLKMQKKHS